MGRGDRRTRRGKIWRNSYGNSRPHHEKVAQAKKPKAKK
jgi:30S ribosomal protein S31